MSSNLLVSQKLEVFYLKKEKHKHMVCLGESGCVGIMLMAQWRFIFGFMDVGEFGGEELGGGEFGVEFVV